MRAHALVTSSLEDTWSLEVRIESGSWSASSGTSPDTWPFSSLCLAWSTQVTCDEYPTPSCLEWLSIDNRLKSHHCLTQSRCFQVHHCSSHQSIGLTDLVIAFHQHSQRYSMHHQMLSLLSAVLVTTVYRFLAVDSIGLWTPDWSKDGWWQGWLPS